MWHGVRRQIGFWTKSCIACQTSKIQRHVRAPLKPIAVPQRRFDHIHVDLVGSLPPSRGNTYLFTVIDRFTRWPEAIPLSDTSTSTCARTLIDHWIARFGLPSSLTSDRGAQFTSGLWTAIAQQLGFQLHCTTAFHPQSNGIVERFHRHLKAALRARLTGPTWTDELPWVLLGIRTAPKEDLGTSSAELVYGAPLTVPGDFIAHSTHPPDPANELQRFRHAVRQFVPSPTTRHGGGGKSFTPPALRDSAFVFIRRDAHRTSLQLPYEGPFRVRQRFDKYFIVDLGGRPQSISVDRLKPAHLDDTQPVRVATPRRRGCPPHRPP